MTSGYTLAGGAGAKLVCLANWHSRPGSQLGQDSSAVFSQQTGALRQTASMMPPPVKAASRGTAPVASPARGMVGKLAQAFGGGRSDAAAAPAADNWEEF